VSSWDGRGVRRWWLSRFPLGTCLVVCWFVGLLFASSRRTDNPSSVGGGEDGEEVEGKPGILKLTTA
jgi:hypothetical protein